MEAAGGGGGDSFVLRSGVRAGLKREFAFAIASQAALEPLGRTRRSSRTLLNTSPEPKRPRPPPPTHPPNLEEQEEDKEQDQASGSVLALMAAAPPSPPPPPPTTMDADVDPAPHTSSMETLESSPMRITRSMLHKPPPPADNAKEAEPPAESLVRRRFTRSLLLKDNKADHSNNDDDLSGTTTVSNSSSPSTTSINKGTSTLHANKIPTNLKELLATGLLEDQPVKYIMRKGKVRKSWHARHLHTSS
jgi:hypothetical protein